MTSMDPVDPLSTSDTATSQEVSPSGLAAPRPVSQTVGRIVLAVLGILVVVFAVANRQRVPFDWIFGETGFEVDGAAVGAGVPLILLLLGAFLLGLVIGWGVTRRRTRVRTYRASQT